jgi:site-specific recombinase XerD
MLIRLHALLPQERHADPHPIQGSEQRALAPAPVRVPEVPFVFVSDRRQPFTTAGSARMIERAAAGLELEAPHAAPCVRHALANKGYDTRAIHGWLEHRSSTRTAVCTALAQKDFWRE